MNVKFGYLLPETHQIKGKQTTDFKVIIVTSEMDQWTSHIKKLAVYILTYRTFSLPEFLRFEDKNWKTKI